MSHTVACCHKNTVLYFKIICHFLFKNWLLAGDLPLQGSKMDIFLKRNKDFSCWYFACYLLFFEKHFKNFFNKNWCGSNCMGRYLACVQCTSKWGRSEKLPELFCSSFSLRIMKVDNIVWNFKYLNVKKLNIDKMATFEIQIYFRPPFFHTLACI